VPILGTQQREHGSNSRSSLARPRPQGWVARADSGIGSVGARLLTTFGTAGSSEQGDACDAAARLGRHCRTAQAPRTGHGRAAGAVYTAVCGCRRRDRAGVPYSDRVGSSATSNSESDVAFPAGSVSRARLDAAELRRGNKRSRRWEIHRQRS